MKKLLLIIILIVIGVGAYCYLTQPANDTTTPVTEKVMEKEMIDIVDEITEDAKEDMEEISYTDLSPEEAKALIDDNPNLVIIDVSPHYDKGHIPGAINYYIGDGSLDEAIPALDPKATYLVYCHVDSASIGGAQTLISAGFENVYRLEGNYAAWVDAGYPVE